MPRPNDDPSSKSAWLLGAYIVAAFLVAGAVLFVISGKRHDPAAPASNATGAPAIVGS